MAIFNEIMILRSIYLVIFGWCLFELPGAHSFHVGNPTFYANIYDYDLVQEKLSPKEESGLITVSDLATGLQSKEIMASNAEVSTSNEINIDLPELYSTNDQHTKISDEIIKTESTKTSAVREPGTDKILFPIDSPPVTDPDPSDDISMQVTRIYLKAITTLIQHIMDAIFFANDTKPSKLTTGTPNIIDGLHDSSPSRKLRKRELPSTEKEPNMSKISTNPSTANTASEKIKPYTDLKDKATDKSTSINGVPSEAHSGSSESVNSLNLHKMSSENHPKTSLLSTSSKAKSEEDDTTDSPHVVSISERHSSTTTAGKGIAAVVSDKTKLKKKESDDFHSLESIMNDENSLLDDSMTGQDNYESNVIGELSTHKFSKKSVDGESPINESSVAGTVFVITGTVLIVIILAAAGTAAAYQLRKRTLGQTQSGNQNPSSHRPSMA